jgi:hypothetical protein
VTTVVQRPWSAFFVWLGGQVRVQAGLTVTVKLHCVWLFDGSLATQATVVMPTGKLDPEAGAQVTVTLQLSVAVGVV